MNQPLKTDLQWNIIYSCFKGLNTSQCKLHVRKAQFCPLSPSKISNLPPSACSLVLSWFDLIPAVHRVLPSVGLESMENKLIASKPFPEDTSREVWENYPFIWMARKIGAIKVANLKAQLYRARPWKATGNCLILFLLTDRKTWFYYSGTIFLFYWITVPKKRMHLSSLNQGEHLQQIPTSAEVKGNSATPLFNSCGGKFRGTPLAVNLFIYFCPCVCDVIWHPPANWKCTFFLLRHLRAASGKIAWRSSGPCFLPMEPDN